MLGEGFDPRAAWDADEPFWVPLAPGVRWRVRRRPDGADVTWVSAECARILGRIYDGRAALEEIGVEEGEMGPALDLDRLAGFASVVAGCLYASRLLVEWEGIDDPRTGQALPVEPGTIRLALLKGPPPGGEPLLTPWLAWVDAPRRAVAAEMHRLRARAKDAFAGGFERCAACAGENRGKGDACARGGSVGGERCPMQANAPRTPEGEVAWAIAARTAGVWLRAGMGGAVSGLDYRAALLAAEAELGRAGVVDHGALFRLFQAIEQGRLEAEAARAPARAD